MPSPILVKPTGAVKKLPTTWHEPGTVFFDSETKTNHIACADGVVRPMAGLLNFLQGHWPEPCVCKTVEVPQPIHYVGPAGFRAAARHFEAILIVEEKELIQRHALIRLHMKGFIKKLREELRTLGTTQWEVAAEWERAEKR